MYLLTIIIISIVLSRVQNNDFQTFTVVMPLENNLWSAEPGTSTQIFRLSNLTQNSRIFV